MEQRRRCVRKVYNKLVAEGAPEGSATTSRAFAICNQSLMDKGYLDEHARPTKKGRAASMGKLLSPQAGRKHDEYEDILATARMDRRGVDLDGLIAQAKRGAANRQRFLRLPGSRNVELCTNLQPLREAMDEVFRCDTAFGTCRVDEGKPSAGHCMLSAMIVQDLFGGEIQFGIVDNTPHYWTRVGNRDVDLTGDQFDKAKIRVRTKLYGGGHVFERDPGRSLELPANREIMQMHERFVKRLIPILKRRGMKDWAAQLGREQRERKKAA
jgi:hypothetical protein